MRQIPNFHGLRAFESAARLGSFLLASDELHLTPSAISHQIRGLEKHFGRSLFIRHNRQVELTLEGQRLFTEITGPFDAIESACAELATKSAKSQRLSFHCTPSFASKWLSPRLTGFMQDHPTINVHVTASADPVDFARQEELDLAIAYGKPLVAHGVSAEPLGTELIAALAAPGVASKYDLTKSVVTKGLVLIDSAVSPVRWSDWFALNELSPPKGVERPSFDRGALSVSAAAQGLGFALETTRFAEGELKSGELVRAAGGRLRDVRREMHFLCYRTAQRDLKKIIAFKRWLLAAIEDGAPL
jgi:LysR family transcriptional regulator, glycine cleavage system transcriptional activator